MNNDIIIIKNQEKCLVYDRAVSTSGISWEDLKTWYDESFNNGVELNERLRESLDSPPERLFYDPKLEKERIKKIFEHQRMDFLMVLSESQRIVIEIDGIQHYSEYIKGKQRHYASVDKYAEMVAAHREMTLAGYDVYRFGGKELHDEVQGKGIIKNFFKMLFEKYSIIE